MQEKRKIYIKKETKRKVTSINNEIERKASKKANH